MEITEKSGLRNAWVVGEVLIDLIATGSESTAKVGGGPANTAIALAKLGVDTFFVDSISTDDYGLRARSELSAAGVNLDYVESSEKPTCVARVTLDSSGGASYEFSIDGSSTFDFRREWLPAPKELKSAVLHIGTLATIVEPGATVLLQWAEEVCKFAPVIYDPNIRPSALNDRARYQESVERWVSISTIVKVSEDDMNWLYPGERIETIFANWLRGSVEVVVLTRGADGIRGFTPSLEVAVPGIAIDVVDTVGAGDTVGAILAEALVLDEMRSFQGAAFAQLLTRATIAAAITCSRSGARPPSRQEIDSFDKGVQDSH